MLIEKLEAQRDTITNSMSRVHGYQKKSCFSNKKIVGSLGSVGLFSIALVAYLSVSSS